MSVLSHAEPSCVAATEPALELVIGAHARDLGGGFRVRRLLPAAARRRIGPFVFFDHMGPVRLPAGEGLDVRPHPHIGLATVTWLFEGEILHRDSLGNEQPITPGAVNWMTAGRGIVHSERSPAAARTAGPALHGLQLWVALPLAHEDAEPAFQHCPAAEVPVLVSDGVSLSLVAGSAYGAVSPVVVHSPLFYVDARLEAGAQVMLPDEHAERGAYVVEGEVIVDGAPHQAGEMLVFRSGVRACLRATAAARVMLLGGAPLDGDRFVWWNFVASTRERIERAKDDWRQRRFAVVPDDDREFIPLPDR